MVPPQWAIHGPVRLTRRPAGLPTDSSLRSASVFDGAIPDQKQERGGLRADRIVWPVLGQSVGGGLPPMAVGQSLMSWLTHRHRGQAPSHSLISIHQLDIRLLLIWLLILILGGPPNHCRITGTPSLSEVPSVRARAFCLLLCFSKVSRRDRRNGYAPDLKNLDPDQGHPRPIPVISLHIVFKD
ncbi:hypothetical protein SAMN03159342_02897 [Pseudomonas sp. NFPP04]|nr:hypothetical protein SAMN03159342_02897 [Pseudomonas sp. NFPP04]SFI91244.1 hypothetical protein SAMN03159344_02198 [Pseudomonas sp. NFPP11]